MAKRLATSPRLLLASPDYLAGTLLRVDVDVDADAEGAELHITYPRDRSASAKVLALTESLRRSFGDPPYWDL